jgi:hypothetical protein
MTTGPGTPPVLVEPPSRVQVGAPWWNRIPVAVRASLLAFVASRLLLVVPVVLWKRDGGGPLWHVWDGGWFVRIADAGYPAGLLGPGDDRSPWAFLPLYPLAVRGVHELGVPTGAGALALNAALGAALAVVLGLLARAVVPEAGAAWGCALFWFFPGSSVLSLAYSEALFLLLVCAGLLALLRERWVLAGLATMLAGATRTAGIALLVACAVAAIVAVRRGRRRGPLVALALAPLGAVAFAAYGRLRAGSWLVWRRAEEDWDQHVDFGLRMPGSVRHDLFGGGGNGVWWIVTLASGALLVAAVALLLARRAWLPLPLAVYACATAAILLSSTNVLTRPRFVLSLVPLFPAVAAQLPRRARLLAVAVLAALLPVVTYLYLAFPHVIP